MPAFFKSSPLLRLGLLCLSLTVVAPRPSSGQDPAGFFGIDGTAFVNPEGEPVVLRGVGLGGWLMPEGYMLHISAPDGGSPRTIRQQIQDLIGPSGTDEFFRLYREHYVKEKDIAAIAAWGYDHIRLPFHYNVLYDDATGTFKEDGFALIDTFLEWCRAYGLEVILDMHATPGAQGPGNIADSDGYARLWADPDPATPDPDYKSQTVEIWKEIATRYADEPLIIGYDLINEPVLPETVPGSDLRDLYIRIRDAVREVDTNHILFIEGNYWATDFTHLEPAFDDKMVYAFHKYWNSPNRSTFQYLLDLRQRTQRPLWLGESGENSNTWFYQVTRSMEGAGISWNWWMHKKIESISSPLSAPFQPGYEAVVNYWRGAGPRPSLAAARVGLFNMAKGLDFDSTVIRRDVLAALFHPDYPTMREPFVSHTLPGVIHAVDYDLGNQGVTYSDRDFMTTSGTPGGGNTGGQYRNDGVDIERSSDPQGYAYNVGWTEDNEWLTYTANVETSGLYDVEFRVASQSGGGRLKLLVDGVQSGSDVTIPGTGGWQSWSTVTLRGINLAQGMRQLRVQVTTGGFNFNQMRFVLTSATAAEEPGTANPSTTFFGHYPNPVRDAATITFSSAVPVRARVEVFDVLGRKVQTQPWEAYGAGKQRISLDMKLAPGTYAYLLTLDQGRAQRTFTDMLVVMP